MLVTFEKKDGEVTCKAGRMGKYLVRQEGKKDASEVLIMGAGFMGVFTT